jgi:hypothetical protein
MTKPYQRFPAPNWHWPLAAAKPKRLFPMVRKTRDEDTAWAVYLGANTAQRMATERGWNPNRAHRALYGALRRGYLWINAKRKECPRVFYPCAEKIPALACAVAES